MREETERQYRDGRVAAYEELAKLMEKVQKITLEIAGIEWEMRQHGLKMQKIVLRPNRVYVRAPVIEESRIPITPRSLE